VENSETGHSAEIAEIAEKITWKANFLPDPCDLRVDIVSAFSPN